MRVAQRFCPRRECGSVSRTAHGVPRRFLAAVILNLPNYDDILPPNPASAVSPAGAKLLLRGVQLDLNETTRRSIEAKAERLFRHEPTILRLRIEIERGPGGATWLFRAKGHIEIEGPDLRASVTTEDANKSITLLIDKLDRMLRKRAIARRADRFTPVLSGAN